MSDEQIRALERAYRASGDPADGEAWVQAVLRSTGVPTTFLIARTIELQRVMHAIARTSPRAETTLGAVIGCALTMPVTPDDIVDFLRRGRNWLEPGMASPPTTSAASIEAEVEAEIDALIAADIIREADSGLVSTAHSRARLEQLARTTGFPTLSFNPPVHNARIPRRPVEPGDATLCNHANENPGHCPCEPNCYCRQDGRACVYKEEP